MLGLVAQRETGYEAFPQTSDEPSFKRRKVDSEAPGEPTEGTTRVNCVNDNAGSVNSRGSTAAPMAPRTHPLLTPESQASPASVATLGGVRETLLRVIPSRHELLMLMDKVGLRLALDYRFCSPGTAVDTDPRAAVAALLSPSSHPVVLARQMLKFAAALQSIPDSTTISSSLQYHTSMIRNVTETVIKEVNSNDNYLGSLEGLDNLISEALWHVDCGNLRRAWISFRRCVMVAQLLGLDRPGSPRYKVLQPQEHLDAASMYEYVVRIERVLSLLLGLPTSTHGLVLGPSPHDEGVPEALRTMMVGMSDVIVKVLSRNQLDATPENMAKTRAIDRDLTALAESMPSSYWRPLCFTGMEPTSMQAIEEMQRGYAHACFHSVSLSREIPPSSS
ncbi:hypothetical protein LTR95_011885 [Oleoguttula sp. CCFEE 5521]